MAAGGFLVHAAVGGKHDAIVALRGFAAHQLVQYVGTRALGVAFEWIAESTAQGLFLQFFCIPAIHVGQMQELQVERNLDTNTASDAQERLNELISKGGSLGFW